MGRFGLSSPAKAVPLIALAVLGSGCAMPMPTPSDIPSLEARRAASPSDVELLTSLGIAYREAARLPAARSVLEEALALDPGHAGASYYLGLTAEDQEDYELAASIYETFLTSSASSDLRDGIEDRLARVRRLELLAEVQAVVEEEGRISALPPMPGVVGVFPFVYTGAEEEYRPLATAMSHMLTADLNQVDRITVLERLRVQALVDEIEFGDSDLVDPATASRSGRMLRASQIVQGELGGDDNNLSSTALLVDAVTGVAGESVESGESAQRFLDIEKALVYGLFDGLGIALTVAERERIEDNRTENLQALLAFGRGLEAMDAGNFSAAEQEFGIAVSLDPGFAAASEASTESGQLDRGSSVSTAQAAARGGQELAVGAEYSEWLARQTQYNAIEVLAPTLTVRDPVPEVMGEEGLPIAPLRIGFPRPGGEQ